MVVKYEIIFDQNSFGTYFAGQLVTGCVILKSDKIKEVKAVTLKVSGFAHTFWTKKTFDKRRHYSAHEDYFTNLVYLLGSEESTKCSILAGTHKYIFDFQLPYNCPTSLESLNGHIRYVLKINLIRPWKFNQSFTKGFTVINFKDLNIESPLLRQTITTEIRKIYGCGPCRSEAMNIEVSLPQGGFVPGQSIPITITVRNDSYVPVEAIKIYLVMNVTCYSDAPIRNTTSERIVVSKFEGDGVLSHYKKLYNYELEVPATPPTCSKHCRIIHLNYELDVVANVKGLNTSQILTLPVVIGNVPFHEIIDCQPRSMRKDDKMDLSEQSLDEASTSRETHLDQDERKYRRWIIKTFTELPPKYEEASHVPNAKINAHEPHDYGEDAFKPRYPVFSLFSNSKIVDTKEDLN